MTSGLPLFPLGTVLFPGLVLPLHIFEPRYRALVRDLETLPEGVAREFGVVAIQRGWEVDNHSAALSLHEIGCTAQVRQISRLDDGGFDIVTVGRRRFRVLEIDTHSQPYLTARVEWLPDELGDPGEAERLAPVVLALFQNYLALVRTQPGLPGEQVPDEPTLLSHLVAATATLAVPDRQRLLAAADTVERLRTERRLLTREVGLLRRIRAVPASLADLASPTSPN
ncbi:MAG TPA: LON peptidase substrate-binding domain-containing protein [Micromonosporaceae bacterium]